MKSIIFSVSFLLLVAVTVSAQQTTAFSYQGKLNSNSLPANGQYDFAFEIYDASSGGTLIGTLMINGVTVSNGIFSTQLDFGANAFDGTDRYLEISVKEATSSIYITLSPRQKLASVPYATKAIKAETATTAQNSNSLGGIAADSYLLKNGDASQLTNINGANIAGNSINSSSLASDTFPNRQNLTRLGSLRWDLLGQRVPVGLFPIGVAFDGQNIWTTNASGNSVTKVRGSDGTILGTFPVGAAPLGIAFDGSNIWVVNRVDQNVTKMRASDGQILGTFPSSLSPRAIAFDGENIWVTNFNSNSVAKLRASDGALLDVKVVGTNPNGVAFDGENIWVTNNGSGNVTKLRASDGVVLGTFSVGPGPTGIAFDGANIWVANFSGSDVTKLRAFDGACVGTCTFAVGSQPTGIAFDGVNIWVSGNNNTVTKLRASDGAVLDTTKAGTDPRGIAFDGTNMWVANAGSNNLVKLPVFK